MVCFDESSNAVRLKENLWEYRLVAYPDAAVNAKITEEKNQLYKVYDLESASKTNFYITIAAFLGKEVLEETLIRWIQNICNLQTGFTVSLNNFGGFPPHMVCLRVQDAQPFRKLAGSLKILDAFLESNDCPPLKPVVRHYVEIAGKLPHPVYEKAIREYAQRNFHESFKVDRLLLLKRDDDMNFRMIHSFILPSPLT